VLNICKDRGWSSHQVVARVRRLYQTKKVGHAGTLDPLAEGVLPVLLGKSTRLADWVADGEKVYFAEVLLGRVTSTDDLEGEILSDGPVPDYSADEICAALAQFEGSISQRPPAFSAIKMAGTPAYKHARKGEDIAMPVRTVEISRIDMVHWSHPVAGIVVHCGKGTYIRSIARDLGKVLGCGATLARLVRLRVGAFPISSAVTLGEISRDAESSDHLKHVQPPDSALSQVPAIVLNETQREHAVNGRSWISRETEHATARAYDAAGELLGIVRSEMQTEPEVNRRWRLRLLLQES
jgi:tRNA pseudouridine55 synthase